jgi:hypothetical protein
MQREKVLQMLTLFNARCGWITVLTDFEKYTGNNSLEKKMQFFQSFLSFSSTVIREIRVKFQSIYF